MAKEPKAPENYQPAEAQRRFEATLRGALNTPAKPKTSNNRKLVVGKRVKDDQAKP